MVKKLSVTPRGLLSRQNTLPTSRNHPRPKKAGFSQNIVWKTKILQRPSEQRTKFRDWLWSSWIWRILEREGTENVLRKEAEGETQNSRHEKVEINQLWKGIRNKLQQQELITLVYTVWRYCFVTAWSKYPTATMLAAQAKRANRQTIMCKMFIFLFGLKRPSSKPQRLCFFFWLGLPVCRSYRASPTTPTKNVQDTFWVEIVSSCRRVDLGCFFRLQQMGQFFSRIVSIFSLHISDRRQRPRASREGSTA